jgi:hypothetical protein
MFSGVSRAGTDEESLDIYKIKEKTLTLSNNFFKKKM